MSPGTKTLVWRRRARLALTAAGVLLLGSGIAWGFGFDRFSSAARHEGSAPGKADGIVVLTGGADRIDAGLRLLADGRAPLLLVSGVARGVDLGDLSRRVPLDAGQASRITLGREAQSTSGNAAETAPWVRAHDVRRLIVVTAGYHMPRALLELHRALPGVVLYPMAVQSPALRGAPPATTVRMLATEYNKLLAVRFGLVRLLRMGDTA